MKDNERYENSQKIVGKQVSGYQDRRHVLMRTGYGVWRLEDSFLGRTSFQRGRRSGFKGGRMCEIWWGVSPATPLLDWGRGPDHPPPGKEGPDNPRGHKYHCLRCPTLPPGGVTGFSVTNWFLAPDPGGGGWPPNAEGTGNFLGGWVKIH